MSQSSEHNSASQSSLEASKISQLEVRLAEMQKQLLHLEKMSTVGVLASSITHEFNNILTTVINYAKMGLRHQDAATRDKAFDKILAAGQRAAKITTGMLAYAKDRGSQTDVHSLVQLADDVLVLVEKDLQKHRISLVKNITANAHANVNPSQIQQILLNLIINARQAMEPGGTMTITIGTDPSGPWSILSVKDTGSGIPAEKLPHIFETFYTTKTADESGQGGSGLGLSLCKDIMEAHHGRIRVDSKVGEGTCFTLKLPQAQATGFVKTDGITNKAG
ncbi:ATP-binding protein [Rubinisphaera sp.]|uniref:sensor histidine kinase n=1 Tax=Rubinisphaera sp. TaxID=2024857 RepID=UPI000C106B57|nr:ATP-binding protein [Rubinisphaera sp.]MBV12122.1 two-component sensor histidine kinase [Rubinisphaera sp.]|tara:strand:- start:577 stop:1410 length:834 start_codon:yes stop_codon:yes gene_type:complete